MSRITFFHRPRRNAYLAGLQNTADLPHNRLVTTQVRMALEHEAEIIPEVVALVGAADLHREPDDPMAVRCAYDEPTTEVTLRHDIF